MFHFMFSLFVPKMMKNFITMPLYIKQLLECFLLPFISSVKKIWSEKQSSVLEDLHLDLLNEIIRRCSLRAHPCKCIHAEIMQTSDFSK